MITSVAVLAESMHLCEAMGLDQQQFISLLDGGPLGSVYAVQKLDEMRRHEYPAGFSVWLAVKDLELVREVEQNSGVTESGLVTRRQSLGVYFQVKRFTSF
jgi:3-hydroxyisobutyrate dehydrogenase-like beta-hydroxyacid dehydrogenase